jgi:hypothetical protein
MSDISGALKVTSTFTRPITAHQPWGDAHIEIKFLVTFNDDYERRPSTTKDEKGNLRKLTVNEELDQIIDGCEMKVFDEKSKEDKTITDKATLVNLCKGRVWLYRPIMKAYTNAVMGTEKTEPVRVGNSAASATTLEGAPQAVAGA